MESMNQHHSTINMKKIKRICLIFHTHTKNVPVCRKERSLSLYEQMSAKGQGGDECDTDVSQNRNDRGDEIDFRLLLLNASDDGQVLHLRLWRRHLRRCSRSVVDRLQKAKTVTEWHLSNLGCIQAEPRKENPGPPAFWKSAMTVCFQKFSLFSFWNSKPLQISQGRETAIFSNK